MGWPPEEWKLGDSPASPRTTWAPAAQVWWRKTLSRISTHFGRLVFLASLRDSATGRYCHDDLLRLLGSDDTDRTLCRSHHQVFAEWLGFSLAEQKSDLDEYLQETGSSRYATHYRNLVPPTARDVERQLYLTDLETLLGLLEVEHAAVSTARAAYPLP
ncbi:MAG: hypothetical protein ABSA48_15660 [Terracidiphilus sp.]